MLTSDIVLDGALCSVDVSEHNVTDVNDVDDITDVTEGLRMPKTTLYRRTYK